LVWDRRRLVLISTFFQVEKKLKKESIDFDGAQPKLFFKQLGSGRFWILDFVHVLYPIGIVRVENYLQNNLLIHLYEFDRFLAL
jgi:hypothetical protein